MGWHSSLIAVRRDWSTKLPEFFHTLGLPAPAPRSHVTFEAATSSSAGGRAVGFHDGWTIVTDPYFFVHDMPETAEFPRFSIWCRSLHDGLIALSKGAQSLGIILEGASSTYGFTLYQDGRFLRGWMSQQGDIITDFGTPAEGEVRGFESTEWNEARIFATIESFGLHSNDLFEVPFQLVSAGKPPWDRSQFLTAGTAEHLDGVRINHEVSMLSKCDPPAAAYDIRRDGHAITGGADGLAYYLLLVKVGLLDESKSSKQRKAP